MTTLKEVENALKELAAESKLAKQWLLNDLIKMKLAMTYDDWIDDIHDHKCF